MLISRGEERELVNCSSVKEEGGLISLPFGNRHNVAAGSLGVLVEAAQVGTFSHTSSGKFFCNVECLSINLFSRRLRVNFILVLSLWIISLF